MDFKRAAAIESICWQFRLADWPRAQNRALINALFDGVPPYSDQEVRENNIALNINWLEGTKVAHDARQQFANAFQKPGKFFTARTDAGPVHKRQQWGSIVSNAINKPMKRCPYYFETMRSKFALLVLHGIAPSHWESHDYWTPDALGVEDVMVPSGTLLNLKNLPFFAIYRAYTANQLLQILNGPKIDPRWNKDVLKAAIAWADQQANQLNGSAWPEVWSPEKQQIREKDDSGLYAADAVPVISAWDFYWYTNEGKEEGWQRAIVLDAYGQPGVGGILPNKPEPRTKNIIGGQDQFLYRPGKVRYTASIRNIIQFQFADLSAVAPFRYHSVRSLGFLLYAVCHLQNRLRCKFNEAVFEGLMMYMRVKSADDAERALKINLISRGIIDDSVQFLSPAERWQVNEALVQMGLAQNQQIINENSSSYVQSQDYSKPNVEKTAFQVRAELNATTALISAALLQAYQYQNFEYQEIFRRFCLKDSRDPDVRQFRLACLKAGVPEKYIDPSAWDLEPERVMGSGNKTLELATAETLMQWRPLYAPQAQQEILRVATLAVTDDPSLSKALVPEDRNPVTDSKNDAMVAMGTLMLGLPVQFTDRANRIEITETLLAETAMLMQRMLGRPDKMAGPDEINGLQNTINTIKEQINWISQDKNEKERAKQYQNDVSLLENELKGFVQRLEAAMKAAQEEQASGNGQMKPEDAAKIQAIQVQAEVKAENQKSSHSQRTAERQVSFENKERQQREKHQMEMQERQANLAADVATKDIETAATIRRDNAKAESEPKESSTTE